MKTKLILLFSFLTIALFGQNDRGNQGVADGGSDGFAISGVYSADTITII